MRIRYALVGVAAGTTFALGAAVSPAGAAAGAGDTHAARAQAVVTATSATRALQNQQDALCIDDSATAGLRHNTCNGANYQDFTFTAQSDGSVTIKNVHTGLCVDDSVSTGLRHNTCNSSDYQRWDLLPWDDGTLSLMNVHTGLCVDDSVSAGLRHNTCNVSTYQSFFAV
ncbi:RICIN domain-containing protein [Actinacidiphila epipremni]|uniref:RICIN domain-containing protein n=1 Tax=Actinacidiphila epipremni TaxID=2053013 RepID=A0ABX0ZJK8_9ACTN|nr:RICIN domain-containing protein [Actinacidiphila epipremni]NJP42627.1 RICIN domain-containing protein [Actinacidiphila epipremni]